MPNSVRVYPTTSTRCDAPALAKYDRSAQSRFPHRPENLIFKSMLVWGPLKKQRTQPVSVQNLPSELRSGISKPSFCCSAPLPERKYSKALSLHRLACPSSAKQGSTRTAPGKADPAHPRHWTSVYPHLKGQLRPSTPTPAHHDAVRSQSRPAAQLVAESRAPPAPARRGRFLLGLPA